MVAQLERELADYERLQQGRIPNTGPRPFEDLPDILVEQRIAARLTQRELAERLGMKEQQVQRYEATDYNSASLARVLDVVEAMPEFRVTVIVEPAVASGGYLPAPSIAMVPTNVFAQPLAASPMAVGYVVYTGNIAMRPEELRLTGYPLNTGFVFLDPGAVKPQADLFDQNCGYFDAALQLKQTPFAGGVSWFSPINQLRVPRTQPIPEAQLA
jgi:transcriptional regulator with XRE-family HTH domain